MLDNRRKLIYIGIAAAVLILVITTVIMIVHVKKKPEKKEPKVVTMTIDAPDDMPLEEKEQLIFDYLIEAGYSPAGACGVMGNIAVESSDIDTLAVNEGSGALGLFQWNDVGDRQQHLKDFCKEHKLNWNSIDSQLAFAVYEISGADPIACRLDDFLKETDNAYAAASEFCAGFERCVTDSGKKADRYMGALYPEFYGYYYQGLSKRINKAMNYYERFGKTASDAP